MEQVQKWLDALESIPVAKGWQRSLMDITGIKHHENMWSDIYKFFFLENEQHQMGDLFIRSLEELIGLNHFLSDFTVKREFVVDGDRRIDLLLYNKNLRRAIIIENKVYHSLDNDLNLYQRSVMKMLGDKSDIKTIVLGMHHYSFTRYEQASEIKPSNLFSITHKELLTNDEIWKTFLDDFNKMSIEKLTYSNAISREIDKIEEKLEKEEDENLD